MTEHDRSCPQALPRSEQTRERSTPRYPCVHFTFYRPLRRGEEACVAEVYNISFTGIALLLRQAVAVGTILAVELHSTIPSFSHQRLVRVTHATEQADGRWVIGGEFATRLKDEELQALRM